jgi:hypothetical protein
MQLNSGMALADGAKRVDQIVVSFPLAHLTYNADPDLIRWRGAEGGSVKWIGYTVVYDSDLRRSNPQRPQGISGRV